MTDLSFFLSQARAEGERDSEGAFTLSREQVLEKLASLTFPFHGAWLVRALQALIAGGVEGTIKVELLKKKVTVTAKCGGPWSLAELEEAFFEPQLRVDRAVSHLRTVLWFLVLAEKRETCRETFRRTSSLESRRPTIGDVVCSGHFRREGARLSRLFWSGPG